MALGISMQITSSHFPFHSESEAAKVIQRAVRRRLDLKEQCSIKIQSVIRMFLARRERERRAERLEEIRLPLARTYRALRQNEERNT